jgi:hypothetical protein
MPVVHPHRQIPVSGPRMRLDNGEGGFFACRISMEYRLPVSCGTRKLDPGRAAKIGQAHGDRFRPVGPWLLRKKLAFDSEGILKRRPPRWSFGRRAFQSGHCDIEVRLHWDGQPDE